MPAFRTMRMGLFETLFSSLTGDSVPQAQRPGQHEVFPDEKYNVASAVADRREELRILEQLLESDQTSPIHNLRGSNVLTRGRLRTRLLKRYRPRLTVTKGQPSDFQPTVRPSETQRTDDHRPRYYNYRLQLYLSTACRSYEF